MLGMFRKDVIVKAEKADSNVSVCKKKLMEAIKSIREGKAAYYHALNKIHFRDFCKEIIHT